MNKLNKEDLYTLEEYASIRANFRRRVSAHKANRRVELGEHIALYFEDRLTMQYQIQEILRAEKIFEPGGIQEELNVYNPLIPNGCHLIATLMIQYEDVEERRLALTRLIGIEDTVWLKVASCEKIYPVADEDLDRETDEKTSSVHFLRFEFDSTTIHNFKDGNILAAGIDHSQLSLAVDPLADNIQQALRCDFD